MKTIELKDLIDSSGYLQTLIHLRIDEGSAKTLSRNLSLGGIKEYMDEAIDEGASMLDVFIELCQYENYLGPRPKGEEDENLSLISKFWKYLEEREAKSKILNCSFQVPLPGDDASLPWDSIKPKIHKFPSWDYARKAAVAISKHLGNVKVRIVQLPPTWDGTDAMIGRLSAAYIQWSDSDRGDDVEFSAPMG